MKVTVRYLAQARHAAGVASEQVELDDPCPAAELVLRAAERHGGALKALLLGADGTLQPALLLFVGDEQVGPEAECELKDGDVVTVLSPMAGG